MKTFQNNVILFLVMLLIGLIGFNIFHHQFGGGSTTVEEQATTSPESDGMDVPAVDVQSMPNTKLAKSQVNAEVGDGDTRQVKSMLKNREDAWNNRDLERYMADYRKFDSLRVSINGETEIGWNAVRKYFANAFGPGMGTLRINNMKINMVGDFASIVTAEWNLQQENKITNGRMNLVMKRVGTTWKITTENLTEK